eukprot:Awhi_evm1s14983
MISSSIVNFMLLIAALTITQKGIVSGAPSSQTNLVQLCASSPSETEYPGITKICQEQAKHPETYGTNMCAVNPRGCCQICAVELSGLLVVLDSFTFEDEDLLVQKAISMAAKKATKLQVCTTALNNEIASTLQATLNKIPGLGGLHVSSCVGGMICSGLFAGAT